MLHQGMNCAGSSLAKVARGLRSQVEEEKVEVLVRGRLPRIDVWIPQIRDLFVINQSLQRLVFLLPPGPQSFEDIKTPPFLKSPEIWL